ncbi:amidase domain-containing protein [Lentibacillus saliphilus]|uniref:amidase domain-containing protein n=1 Tax=Lentibacillus saliphilus TaxID=2737028 RepID=UPI001C30E71C|nr:amidase domain-containing protein [Lentibacillus saliphilus]
MKRLNHLWLDICEGRSQELAWWNQKRSLYQQRGYSVIQVRGSGELYRTVRSVVGAQYEYMLHMMIVLKKGDHIYIEEESESFSFELNNGDIVNHRAIEKKQTYTSDFMNKVFERDISTDRAHRFIYDRQAAVKYAERWWNSYNPQYRTFDVDCTNYVSQCLYAGGAPMRGAPNRAKGWWYQNDNWSFSWAVAHSLRWYLSGSTTGLKGAEVEQPSELMPGDVICYDFEGDGRWDHNTIVVAKDIDNMPLVNAHTNNSRMRYWSYEDSLAWTPECNYKFFRIG